MSEKVCFYVVQKLSGNKVVFVHPEAWRFEEAKEYCKTASRIGQRYAMTRVTINLHLRGKEVVKSLSFAA